ncbi:hypothetical protein [Salinigranum sp. GCM10025319]|uniref:hypothetical protein n=1 Tax=Salinigranum sp. GCM10025319 TaxID=3252687 RepID=UPI0036148BA3
MPSTRRALLRAAGVAAAVAVTGCLGGVDAPAARTETRATRSTADGDAASPTAPRTETNPDRAPATGERTPGGTPTPDPTRADGEPISTREAFVDGDEYTYLNDSNAVRYVSAYRHTNREAIENGSAPEREPVYDTIPFARWGRTRCASAAATAVAETTADRLDRAELTASVGITSRHGDLSVLVVRTVTRDRDGDLVSRTEESFDDLVTAAPRTVDATVTLADREHESTVPVWVEFRERRYA